MTTCARPGCPTCVLSWLDRTYCSRRCRAIDVAPERAQREAVLHAGDRAAYHTAREEMATAGYALMMKATAL